MGPGVAAAFTVGAVGLAASLVEPWLLWRLRGRSPSRLVPLALAASASGCLAAGLLPSPWLAAMALLVLAPASGVACAFSQSALVAAAASPERATARWSLAGAVGDLLAPALLIAVGLCGLSFRAAFLAVAALQLGLAALIARAPGGAAGVETERPRRASFAQARRNRTLLAAAGGALACTFLDELVLGVGALFFDGRLGAPATQGVLGALVAGGLLGAAAAPRAFAGRDPARLLALAAGVSGASYAAALAVEGAAAAGALLFLTGAAVAWHYPLAMALAFRAAGDEPDLAPAVAAWFLPLEAALPFAVALLAETAGVAAAMASLALQPLLLLCVALALLRYSQRSATIGSTRVARRAGK